MKYANKPICMCLLMFLVVLTSCSSAIEITDADEYHDIMKRCDYFQGLFPEEIPRGAHIAEFYYYDDDLCHYEVYLELQFDCEETLIAYIDAQKNAVGIEDIFEQVNPQDHNYVDMYCVSTAGHRGQNRIYWYRWEDNLHNAFYRVTSYSKTDLSVVITYFVATDGCKIPKYYSKFDIPMNKGENHEYEVIIPKPTSANSLTSSSPNTTTSTLNNPNHT